MRITADMHYKNSEIFKDECVVEKVVMLRPSEFSYICKNLLDDNEHIKENFDEMYYDKNDVAHCLMFIKDDSGEGLLAYSEDGRSITESAYIPNAKLLWDMERYPALKDYVKRMAEVADDILSKAVASSTVENRFYEVDIEKYNIPGEPIADTAMFNNMLADSEMVEDTILHDGCIEIALNEINNEPDKRILDQQDVDIMLAKHTLWLNDAGGEQADFSNCILKHLNFSGKNMLNAILENAEFSGCNFENAEMCFSVCNNTKFETCDMSGVTAEESEFKNSVFDNCSLQRAVFTHSDFTDAKFLSTRMDYAELSNSCLENIQSTNTNFVQANMDNVSYDEDEWVQDGENFDNGICQSM